MIDSNTPSYKKPPTKITYLKDGRVQVTFQHFDIERLVDLPSHMYAIFQGLLLSTDPIPQHCIDGVFAMIELAYELLPDSTETINAIRKYNHIV